jgi:peroxiredoxin family protein
MTMKDLMRSLKDEWALKNKELYNEQGSVIFNAYLQNLSHTVSVVLAAAAGRKVRVDLTQGRNKFKKMKLNVTSMHQNKFRRTK